jgi:solute carrier family 25 carnitine/acylcarnitine transporter 20/29
VVRYAVQHHGLTGLWRGVGISTLRDGIGVAAFFSAKRTVERALATNQRFNAADEETKASSSFATTVLAGGMAGLSYWVASLPLDTIKTWIQSSDLGQPPPAVGASLRDAYYAADGNLTRVAQRLIRGWQVAYGRGIPSAAITITVYSAAYDALQEG